jgi:hypothetical protein
MMRLLDFTSSCKQWIVEKTFAQYAASLNLCLLFDRESEDINSGETTLNSGVTLTDDMAKKNEKKSAVAKASREQGSHLEYSVG